MIKVVAAILVRILCLEMERIGVPWLAGREGHTYHKANNKEL